MNDSGIASQYGFLYQRKIFVLYAIRHMNAAQFFTFEGKDDVEIANDDKIYAMFDVNNSYVQVKSGKVNVECFSRVIGNWLLLDSKKSSEFELVLEHDLDFVYTSKESVETVYHFIIDGKAKKASSIARRVYDKFKDTISTHSDELLNQIQDLLTGFKKSIYSMIELDCALSEKFDEYYCSDIHDYSLAKEKRLERFISYINKGIDDAIKIKKPYVLIYSKFISLIIQVSEEISDHKYTIDTLCLKKKSIENAQKLTDKRILREVKQLFLVADNQNFVVNGIVHELIYKDFREVYAVHKAIEISNLEQAAKENFDSAVFALGDRPYNSRSVYLKTTEQQLDSDFLPKGPIYQKGCYIYLTGDDITEDFQITWGENNDNK